MDPEEEITERRNNDKILKCSISPNTPYQYVNQEAECDLSKEVTSQFLQYDVNTDSQENEEAGDEYRDGIEYSRKVLSGNIYLVTNYEQSSQLKIIVQRNITLACLNISVIKSMLEVVEVGKNI